MKILISLVSLLVLMYAVFNCAYSQTIHLRLTEIYYSNEDYKDIMDVLKTTNNLVIHFSSPGGDINAMHDMIGAIKHARGKVTCVLDNYAASAATMIFMSCENKVIAPGTDTKFIIHLARLNYERSDRGFVELEGNNKHWTISETLKVFGKILKPEEIKYIKNYGDLFLTGEELRKRLGL